MEHDIDVQHKTMTEATAEPSKRQLAARRRRRTSTVANYGHEMMYLIRRLRSTNPEIHQRWLRGELSPHAAAVEAGIISKPPPHLRKLEVLCQAWERASLDDRQAFLLLYGEDIAAAEAGEYIEPERTPRRGGHRPFMLSTEETIPALEALLEAGETVTGVARTLGVSHRTVCRWRSGQTKPSPELRQRLENLAADK